MKMDCPIRAAASFSLRPMRRINTGSHPKVGTRFTTWKGTERRSSTFRESPMPTPTRRPDPAPTRKPNPRRTRLALVCRARSPLAHSSWSVCHTTSGGGRMMGLTHLRVEAKCQRTTRAAGRTSDRATTSATDPVAARTVLAWLLFESIFDMFTFVE